VKAAYLVTPPMQGSRYKFIEMFSRLCQLDVVPKLTANYDFAIVRGDKSRDYQKAMQLGLPYILIEHDVWSVRAGVETDKHEREMIENAACVLFTSAHHADLAAKYTIPPSEYIHLRPLAKDLDFEPLPKLPGRNLVYAGGIMGSENEDIFGYRKYAVSVFPALMAAGWTIHVYPAWNALNRTKEYEAIGCIMHEPVPQKDLYRELSQYQAGFQGYAECGPQEYVKSCRPNKLWEYLGAGIPTLGYNTGSGAHIYEGKWGYVAETWADIPAVSERVLNMTISDDLRRSEVIDNDIDAFARLVDIASVASANAIRPELHYPVSLATRITLEDGTVFPKGFTIGRDMARMLKEQGHLTDRRIV